MARGTVKKTRKTDMIEMDMGKCYNERGGGENEGSSDIV